MTAVLRAEEPSARYLVEIESTLTRGFELLATAQDGVPRIRGLLLSLAAQGKLVPQDASDEPADVLLARIHTEKSSPGASDRIKRAKYPRAMSNSDEPFEVPSSWVWARLGAITTFGECDKASDIGDTTWVLDLEDIDKVTGRIARRVTFAERRSLSDKNVFRAQDVLYGKLRPYLNKVAVADADGVCTTEIIPFRGYGGISPHYLRTVIQSPYFLAYVNAKSYGMKMPRLGTDDGRSAWIPLPPLAEQHRIVARVEELMKLCDALEQNGRLADEQHARLTSTLFDALAASESAHALAENWQRVAEHFDLLLDRPEAIDSLEQTILQLAVRGLLRPQNRSDEPASALLVRIRAEMAQTGTVAQTRRGLHLLDVADGARPFNLPIGWAWARFPELGLFGRGKSKHRPRNDPSLFNPGIYPLIQTGEVSRANQFIDEVHSHYSEVGLAQSRLWPAGTMCITIAANIAECAILSFDACFPDSVVGFVPSRLIGDARYFLAFMKTARQRLVDFAPSTAQKNINLDILNNVLIPLPPAAEQHRIVARVEELRRLCADLRQQLTQARETQSRLADSLVAESVR